MNIRNGYSVLVTTHQRENVVTDNVACFASAENFIDHWNMRFHGFPVAESVLCSPRTRGLLRNNVPERAVGVVT